MTIYEEWKKKHGLEGAPSSSSSLLDGYMKKKAETAYTKINEALSGYEASANNYIKNYNVECRTE